MHSRLAIFVPNRLDWDSAGDFRLTGSGVALACVNFTRFARISRKVGDLVVGSFRIGFCGRFAGGRHREIRREYTANFDWEASYGSQICRRLGFFT
jgi:hypothetical protein